MTRGARRTRWAVGALALAACAQASSPPGGPPDPVAPEIVEISPDSGSIAGRPREVVFRFDEVISERPQGATTLAGLVEISPYHGEPEVRWRRSAISARPAGGWRDSTVYTVRLLPGVADLRGNVREEGALTVFSTGGPIPTTRVAGVVFDWLQGRALPNAWVQAITLPDSVIYTARADSTGRFVVPYVPAGDLLVRGIRDENRNFAADEREAWDSVRVTLRDSVALELYLFVHDTLPVGVANVTMPDSVTVQLELDKPLALAQRIDTSLVAILDADSARVPVVAVLTQAVADSLSAAARAAADTAARADTTARPDTAARPVPPPVRPPAADTARDTTPRLPPPEPTRPIPVSRVVVRLARPLTPGATYRVVIRDAASLMGVRGTRDRTFTVPEAAPRPPGARPDTGSAAPRPAPRPRR